MNTLIRLISWVVPVPVERGGSTLSPGLEVRIEQGRYVLNSRGANYSFGQLHRVFRRAFDDAGIAKAVPARVLVLGLGAGSVPAILLDEYGLASRITGVDADERVLALREKYFLSGRQREVVAVHADASAFLAGSDGRFDLVAVDLFIDRQVPERFMNESFFGELARQLAEGGTLFFNLMPKDREEAERLRGLMQRFVGTPSETHTGPNTVFRAVRKGK